MNYLRPITLILSTCALLLSACGGSEDSDSRVRLINATTDYAALDLYTEDDKINSDVAADAAGSYVGVSTEEQTFKVTRAGSGSSIVSFERNVAADTTTSFIAYYTGEALRLAAIDDDEADDPDSGKSKLRIFNAATEAGTVDVFVTDANTSLNDATATASAVAGERFSSFSEMDRGTYRIRVTASGDKNDLRLDIPEITLTDKQIATLVLTKTSGGTLVHGLLINQEGAVQAFRNRSARVRLVAGVTESGVVSATLNGQSISAGLRSPAVGNYVLVPAGSLSADLRLNDGTLAAGDLSLMAGADASLAVLGTPAASSVVLLADDNRPSTNTANARIRLVNGVVGLNAAITLTADYSSVATDVFFATASSPTAVGASADYRLEASSPAAASPLYLAEEVNLQATRVYTVFMLGEASSPVGILRRDR